MININIKKISISTVSGNSSGVFVGNNFLPNSDSFAKSNTNVSGNNVSDSVNILIDKDGIDFGVVDKDDACQVFVSKTGQNDSSVNTKTTNNKSSSSGSSSSGGTSSSGSSSKNGSSSSSGSSSSASTNSSNASSNSSQKSNNGYSKEISINYHSLFSQPNSANSSSKLNQSLNKNSNSDGWYQSNTNEPLKYKLDDTWLNEDL